MVLAFLAHVAISILIRASPAYPDFRSEFYNNFRKWLEAKWDSVSFLPSKPISAYDQKPEFVSASTPVGVSLALADLAASVCTSWINISSELLILAYCLTLWIPCRHFANRVKQSVCPHNCICVDIP